MCCIQVKLLLVEELVVVVLVKVVDEVAVTCLPVKVSQDTT